MKIDEMAQHCKIVGNSVPLNCPCTAHPTGMQHAMKLVPKVGRHYLFAFGPGSGVFMSLSLLVPQLSGNVMTMMMMMMMMIMMMMMMMTIIRRLMMMMMMMRIM